MPYNPNEGYVRGTGIPQEVTPHRQRHLGEELDRLADYAMKSQTHLWIVVLTHRAPEAVLDQIDNGTQGPEAMLDVESMLGVPAIACFVCERLYDPRDRRRKCPGEPR